MIKINLRKNIILRLIKMSQAQDIRTMQGVHRYLFGDISWGFINKIVNILNLGIFEEDNKLNYQKIIMNPSVGSSKTGALKNMIILSRQIWKIVKENDNGGKPYDMNQAHDAAVNLLNLTNSLDFVSQNGAKHKTDILNNLNSWISTLKSS